MLDSRSIDAKSIILLTTDGAPSMIGRDRGLTARLKEDNHDMTNYTVLFTNPCCVLIWEMGFRKLWRLL